MIVAPCFVWNWGAFGHLMPISGALKSAFPAVVFDSRRFLTYHAH